MTAKRLEKPSAGLMKHLGEIRSEQKLSEKLNHPFSGTPGGYISLL